MKEKCAVSVICITYNQSSYLKSAIESILDQKTSFNYEIIVHDDCSNDGTSEILMELSGRYPDKIVALFEEENQYSKGVDIVADLIQNKASGKYIAFCEGDDFWIDENKLQTQYDAMEKHLECDMCACWGCTVTEDGNEEVSQIRPLEHDGILPMESVIIGGGQYLVTAGLFFRKSMYDKMLSFEKVIPLDYAQQLKGALRGGIYYIDRKMAVYRRYAKGSWTNDVLKNNVKLKQQWEKEKNILYCLDEDTGYKYHDVIEERLKAYTSFETQLEEKSEEIQKILSEIKGSCYIWGYGRRGKSLEVFFNNIGYKIDGICDAINEKISEQTEYGNIIFSTEYVMKNADVIIASTQFAYDDLINSVSNAKVLNFQQYMPYG